MKTKLTKSEIVPLAKLSAIKLTESEIESLSAQLSDIISFFEELKKVDTSSLLPTSQTTSLVNITRKDDLMMEHTLSVNDALFNAPETQNNMFKVPMILKKE